MAAILEWSSPGWWAQALSLGFPVGFSIAAPSFQASDLIKVLGIGSVAIGFAFQNILQNFLAGLLLLWTESFRVGDQIRLDNFEGTVEEIETRATTIKTYDGRRVVIPNADLFTRAVTINIAFDSRRWDYEATVQAPGKDIPGLKARIVDAVRKAEGVLAQPVPEVLVVGLGEPGSNTLRVRVTWWNRPRDHAMVTTHDRVLTAISEAGANGAPNPAEQPRAA
jgi:small conductance mechanosensitive channel